MASVLLYWIGNWEDDVPSVGEVVKLHYGMELNHERCVGYARIPSR